jgi:EcsC protein family
MPTKSESKTAVLTEYEGEQVREIAQWKAKPPNPFVEPFKRLTLSASNLVEKVIPDRAARRTIDKLYIAATSVAIPEDVKREAGVADLAELRNKPLEECDRLALRVGVGSKVWATIEGAATGAGGILTTMVDVPLLFVLSLRTIIKIGQCYGYPLDKRSDQCFVMGVMVAALSDSLVTKQNRLKSLRAVETLLLEEVQEEILAEEALSFLFQLEIFEGVPGVGMISGAVLNHRFMQRVDNTARRVFQERWLHDTGKVTVIEPAPTHTLHLVPGWSGALARAGYASCYAVSFAASLPVWTVVSLVKPRDNAFGRGLADGAQTADRAMGVPRMASRAGRNGAGLVAPA